MEGKDFEIFLSFLWTYRYENQTALNKEDSLAAVLRAMDILCIDFKHSEHKQSSLRKNQSICSKSIETQEIIHTKSFATPKISGAKPPKAQSESNKENRACMNVPRKTQDTKDSSRTIKNKKMAGKSIRKAKASVEPLIKKEVVVRNHRVGTTYGLRRNIKKVKFSDEISDPSDLEDDVQEDLLSVSESDEYKPDDEIDGGIDNDIEDSEDDDISDENDDLDDEDNKSYADEVIDTDEEDLFYLEQWDDIDNEQQIVDSEEAITAKDLVRLARQERSMANPTETMTMFTVKVCPDGTVEVLNQEEASKPLQPGCETAIALVAPSMSENNITELTPSRKASTKSYVRGRKRKIADDHGNFIGFGRVVHIMEDEKEVEIGSLQSRVMYSTDKLINPRSLLKAKTKITGAVNLKANDQTTLEPLSVSAISDSNSAQTGSSCDTNNAPLILCCSICGYQCNTVGGSGAQHDMRHHAACKHPRSRFFVLPPGNPHRECVQCTILMDSYERTIALDANIGLKGIDTI